MSGKRQAFTLIEMLVVFAIIAILLAITIPGVVSSRRMALRTQCANHQWQIGRAFHHYMSTFNKVPSAEIIRKRLGPYMEHSTDIFTCPAIEDPAGTSFAVNTGVKRIKLVDSNLKIVAFDGNEPEVDLVTNNSHWRDVVAPRHFEAINVLYFDGHIESRLFLDVEEYVVKNPTPSPISDEQELEIAEEVHRQVLSGKLVVCKDCPLDGNKPDARYRIVTEDGITLHVCSSTCKQRIESATPEERLKLLYSNRYDTWLPSQ